MYSDFKEIYFYEYSLVPLSILASREQLVRQNARRLWNEDNIWKEFFVCPKFRHCEEELNLVK